MSRYCTSVIFLIIALGAAESPRAQTISDVEYFAQLVGTWSTRDIYDQGNHVVYGEKTYCRDGSAAEFVADYVRNTNGLYEEAEIKHYKSKWRIEGDVVVIFDIKFYPPDPYWDGLIIEDKIIEISEQKVIFLDLEYGDTFERFRVSETMAHRSLCERPSA